MADDCVHATVGPRLKLELLAGELEGPCRLPQLSVDQHARVGHYCLLTRCLSDELCLFQNTERFLNLAAA